MRHVGTINYWYQKYGMGFAKSKTIRGDVWVHYSTAPKGVRYRAGTEIEFDMVASARGPQAANVTVIGEATAKIVSVPRHVREKVEQDISNGLDPVAWSVSKEDDMKTSPWHYRDPMFPEQTMCGVTIPEDRVVEGGAYPTNCRVCRGRAERRQKELKNGTRS